MKPTIINIGDNATVRDMTIDGDLTINQSGDGAPLRVKGLRHAIWLVWHIWRTPGFIPGGPRLIVMNNIAHGSISFGQTDS